MNHWYFAYGSNLWIDQMRARVGSHFFDEPSDFERRPRIATLPNHRVAFNMRGDDDCYYANIVATGDGVMGVIYRCNEHALSQLDIFESGYDRRTMSVVDGANRTLEAMVYVARPETTTLPGAPAHEYVETILRGGAAHGLPENYLRGIATLARGYW